MTIGGGTILRAGLSSQHSCIGIIRPGNAYPSLTVPANMYNSPPSGPPILLWCDTAFRTRRTEPGRICASSVLLRQRRIRRKVPLTTIYSWLYGNSRLPTSLQPVRQEIFTMKFVPTISTLDPGDVVLAQVDSTDTATNLRDIDRVDLENVAAPLLARRRAMCSL